MKKVILGIGNPGKEYEKTRHNIGIMLLDYQVKKQSITYQKAGSLTAAEDPLVIYLRSNMYMNLSGKTLKKFVNASPMYKSQDFLKEKLYVSQDFLELEPGDWRIKNGGSAQGHNGIKSIVKEFAGFNEFKRICIGIGRPNTKNSEAVANFVLEKLSKKDLEIYHNKVFPEIHKYLNDN